MIYASQAAGFSRERSDAGSSGIAHGLGRETDTGGGSGSGGCRPGWSITGNCATCEGEDRAAAAKIGAMDRQTLCDWVHRFNVKGPEGLINRKPAGAVRRLTPEQEAELTASIEAGPDFERDVIMCIS